MNCKQVRQGILDLLASGESAPPAELLEHQQVCAGCRNYFKEQAGLFRSMDEALGRVVNSAVPVSLLPRIHARSNEIVPAPSFRFYGWPIAAVAAATLMIVVFVLFRHGPRSSNPTPEITHAVTPKENKPVRLLELPKFVHNMPRQLAKVHVLSPPSLREVQAPIPEVIVLVEEREAFAHFVAQVPDNPAVVVALTRPALTGNESEVEIMLLKIDSLELKPLESAE
jgi:hypothetical protein